MLPTSWVTRGKIALEGTETEKKFANILYDENVKVLSSFQLNQVASLTYGDLVCDQIFEILEDVMAHPINNSPLCLQKAVVISKHCLIYGSEKCVNSVWGLGRFVDDLREYNTVLLAQQKGTPDAWWQRVKGGGVDKGMPVREAAKELFGLIQSKEQIQLLRHTSADPNSLVPVGDKKAAFVSDDVRHFMLQKRMEEQLGMMTRSNLAKAEGGWGSGYQAKDGKTVVGAAHGVEEMLAAAKREKKRYTDDGPPPGYNPPGSNAFAKEAPAPAAQTDFLDFGEPPQPVSAAAPSEVDLLDMSAAVETKPNTNGLGVQPDRFEPSPASDDLLGIGYPSSSSAQVASTTASSDLLGMPTTDFTSSLSEPAVSQTADLLTVMTVTPSIDKKRESLELCSGSAGKPADILPEQQKSMPPVATTKPIMGSNRSNFAALDELVPASGSGAVTPSSAEDAMKRILGDGGSNGGNAFAGLGVLGPAPAPSMGATDSLGMGLGDSMAAPAPSMGLTNSLSMGFGGSVAAPAPSMGLTNSLGMGVGDSLPPMPTTAPPLIAPDSTLKIGATFGGSSFTTEDDDDSGFGPVFGGAAGSGLQPRGPPPPVPPPPPPS